MVWSVAHAGFAASPKKSWIAIMPIASLLIFIWLLLLSGVPHCSVVLKLESHGRHVPLHIFLNLPGNKPDSDVHRLVFFVDGFMNFDIPGYASGHETGCLLQKPLVVFAVV